VLDKTAPLSKRTDSVYPPRRGDYHNTELSAVTVKAGGKIENMVVDCTDEVTYGTE
jgi:hypothetical protein